MAKFLNINKGSNTSNNKFITPAAMNEQYVQNNETFVYNSVPKNQMNYQNNGYNNGYNNGQYNNQMMNGNQNGNYNGMNNNYNQQGYNQGYMGNQFGNGNYQNNGMVSNQDMMMPAPPEVETLEVKEIPKEMDPLNNATNAIPANPVAPKEEVIVEEELPKDVKANIFSALGMMIGMIFKPGTTIINNCRKYKSMFKALSVTMWVTVISLILCIGVRVICGAFVKNYNSVTGVTNVYMDFSRVLFLDNYLPYLLITLLVTVVGISIISLVYYASSFLNSKGVHMGTYFMVSTLAMVPLMGGVVIGYPLLSLLSEYLGWLILIFSFLYSLTSFLIGMNEVLTFSNINKRILYNVLNLSVIFMVMIVIVLLCFRLNLIIPPEINL